VQRGTREWVGTTLTFDLQEADGETVVLFTHGGWREPVPFLHHCTTKWGVYLLGMRTWLQGGSPSSFPDDPAISGWGCATRHPRTPTAPRRHPDPPSRAPAIVSSPTG